MRALFMCLCGAKRTRPSSAGRHLHHRRFLYAHATTDFQILALYFSADILFISLFILAREYSTPASRNLRRSVT